MLALIGAEAKEGSEIPEDGDMFANPIQARAMQPMMRIMMDAMM